MEKETKTRIEADLDRIQIFQEKKATAYTKFGNS